MNVKELEKQIVALKLSERNLIEERNRSRVRMLMNAENHPLVNKTINDLFMNREGIRRPEIERFSQQGRCSGRNKEEHLSEVLVTLTLGNIEAQEYFRGCVEFTIRLKITDGFEDPEARLIEKRLTDEILDLRSKIDALNDEKKQMRGESKISSRLT